jgi:uncharacterized protein (TIGR02452 family)
MNKLQKIAEDTIAAIDAGEYKTPSGKMLSLKRLMKSCIDGSRLYKPSDLEELNKSNGMTRKIIPSPQIIVTRESTLEAAARLASENPCVLNFASAKHPGGGFLRGAPTQEESICRSSGLYPTLIQHPEFYEENKRSQRKNIGLYLDYAIYSPNVPIFRNDAGEWLDEPYFASIVTSPAPNVNAIRNDEDEKDSKVQLALANVGEVFDKRIHQVLSIMAAQGHSTLILGAWGCGAFGNDPLMVASLFKENLKKLPFFDTIVFAIYDRPDSEVFRTFVQIFGPEVDPLAGTSKQFN